MTTNALDDASFMTHFSIEYDCADVGSGSVDFRWSPKDGEHTTYCSSNGLSREEVKRIMLLMIDRCVFE
jgi:hypothetical protein